MTTSGDVTWSGWGSRLSGSRISLYSPTRTGSWAGFEANSIAKIQRAAKQRLPSLQRRGGRAKRGRGGSPVQLRAPRNSPPRSSLAALQKNHPVSRSGCHPSFVRRGDCKNSKLETRNSKPDSTVRLGNQAGIRNSNIMFCPQCGQERISEATSFCSRCGYLLTGTAELLQTAGAAPKPGKHRSPRSSGILTGVFMIMLMFLVAPIIGLILRFGLDMVNPWPVGIVVALLGVGGVLRIVYALMFESKYPAALTQGQRELPTPASGFSTAALPPQRTTPASEYASPASAWRDPETAVPGSVTDNTTKLLEKDPE